jgi:hypothetical protein
VPAFRSEAHLADVFELRRPPSALLGIILKLTNRFDFCSLTRAPDQGRVALEDEAALGNITLVGWGGSDSEESEARSWHVS